jgi:hypothetical protein
VRRGLKVTNALVSGYRKMNIIEGYLLLLFFPSRLNDISPRDVEGWEDETDVIGVLEVVRGRFSTRLLFSVIASMYFPWMIF